MSGRTILWAVLAVLFLMNTGCCRMWENVCDRPHRGLLQSRQDVPYCQPAPPQCICPPQCTYAPPPAVAPVGGADWRR